jgi:MFS transporter, ACDE family, multidrug resistance protein
VQFTIVTGEDAIDIESTATATELLDACVTELQRAEVPVFGEVLHTVGTHAAVASRILQRARELSATAIVLGPETRHGPLAARVTAQVAASAPSHVIVLHPAAGPLGQANGRPDGIPPAERWTATVADSPDPAIDRVD